MRPPSVHLYYTHWEEWLGEDWGATNLPSDWLLAPFSAALGVSCRKLRVRARRQRRLDLATNLLFYFIYHLFHPATIPATGMVFVPSTQT